MIYSTYAKVLPRVGGYLTERGSLEVKRFETFLSLLAEHERENFENEMADQKFMKGKRNQMIEKYGDGTISSTDIRERRKKSKKLEELENLAKQQEAEGVFEGDLDQGDLIPIPSDPIGTDMGLWDAETKQEFVDYRNQYYHGKFGKRLTKEFQKTGSYEIILLVLNGFLVKTALYCVFTL